MPPNPLQNFSDRLKTLKKSENINENLLIEAYYENSLKDLYYKYLKILENKVKDPIVYMRKNIISYLSELVLKTPEQEKVRLLKDISGLYNII